MCREAVASREALWWNGSVWLLLALVPAAIGVVAFATWRASRAAPGAVEVGGRPRWPEG